MVSHSGLITVMQRAVRKAAPRLRRDFGEVEQLQVSRKGPADFVSMADKRAEQTIVEELRNARPDWGMLLEEGGDIAGNPDKPRWIVDPLDGTTNFLHGIPHFSISIAVEEKRPDGRGEITHAMVYQPTQATTVPTNPGSPAPTTAPPPPTTAPSALSQVQIKLSRVATFADPTAMSLRAGDGSFYVAEKRGRVRAFRGGAVDPAPVLDISGDVSQGTDLGLLGLAFSPDGSRLYVNYTSTDANTTKIVEYTMNGGTADPATRRELLSIPQPSGSNKGGQLAFGPDGMLWIGMGDGSTGGDPLDNAQKLTSLLGKILRIDPRPSATAPYTIPPDNPFVTTPGARPEIWAYGLRNPARFSFDRANGDLWIGDIGQNARDEVDLVAAGSRGGQNFGWSRLEGTRPYSGAAPANAVPPLFDIPRSAGGCGITGGQVYRGIRIGGLIGAYVYADRCVGQVTAVRQSGGQVTDTRAFPATAKNITAFGIDGAGELYALTQDGGLHRIDPA